MQRKDENGIIIICIYVDDVLQIGDKLAIEKFSEEIKNIFTVKSAGSLDDYLGCEIKFDDKGAIIH